MGYNTDYSKNFFSRVANNKLHEPSIDNLNFPQTNESVSIKSPIQYFYDESKQIYELEFTITYENEQRKPIGRIQEDKDEFGKLIYYHSFTKYNIDDKSKSGVYVLLSKDVNIPANKTCTMKGYLIRPKNSKYILFEPINKQFFK